MIPEELNAYHVSQYMAKAEELRRRWQNNLAGQGVIFPDNAPVRLAQLVGLYFFLGKPVSKDSLGKFVNKVAGGGLDTQVRHLRSLGWAVVGGGRGEAQTNHLPDGTRMPRGSYALLSVTQADVSFVRSTRLKRQGRVGAHDWNELVAYYGFRCAHCGRNTRNPDKGHLDPSGKFELQNMIPLCVDCNNWALDDVIFSQTGRVKAIRSERFLVATDEAALRRIYAWLHKRLKV